jgi:hypothetical protein
MAEYCCRFPGLTTSLRRRSGPRGRALLSLTETDVPEPSPGEVLLRITARVRWLRGGASRQSSPPSPLYVQQVNADASLSIVRRSR